MNFSYRGRFWIILRACDPMGQYGLPVRLDPELRVRVRRIELLPQAWEAHILPLNYTRNAPCG